MASDAANMRVGANDGPKNLSKKWYDWFMFRPGRDSSRDDRSNLLVVATLIAAVTFQAGVNPPGGVWQETSGSHPAGKSILGSSKGLYTLFIFSNTFAYASAIQVIFFLVVDGPFQLEVWIAILSMSLTYGASIASVQPSGVVSLEFLAIAYFTPFILRSAVQTVRNTKYSKECCCPSV